MDQPIINTEVTEEKLTYHGLILVFQKKFAKLKSDKKFNELWHSDDWKKLTNLFASLLIEIPNKNLRDHYFTLKLSTCPSCPVPKESMMAILVFPNKHSADGDVVHKIFYYHDTCREKQFSNN